MKRVRFPSSHAYLLAPPNDEPGEDDCACPDNHAGLFSPPSFDTDCACPEGEQPFWETQPGALPFVAAGGCLTHLLPGSHTLVFNPLSPSGPVVLSQDAMKGWAAFDEPHPLITILDHQMARQGLLRPVGLASQPQPAAPHTLIAWLHVTNACNLDCPFCYVRKSSEAMASAVGETAIRELVRSAQARDFRILKLKYAGGESTLHFDLVQRLHGLAASLCQAVGLELQEVVLSNGMALLPQQVDWLLANNVRLMLSLDGVGAAHDRQRPSLDGSSAFAALQRTVDEVLLPRGLRPQVCVTVTGRNVDDVSDAVRWALQRGLRVSLNFYRQAAGAEADLALEDERILRGMRAAYAVFEELLPIEPFLGGLLDRFQPQAHLHTCGVGRSYIVVDHLGRVGQCQMQLDQASHPANGQDWLSFTAAGPIQNLPVDEKSGCHACAFRYRCTGGCPIETFRARGRFDASSPNCRIYKALYPEALRLEGLRLLKEHHLLQ